MFRDNEVASVFILGKPVRAEDVKIQEEELESVGWYDLEETVRACERRDPAYCVPIGGLKVLVDKLAGERAQ
jgi:hypothetical protein